jgi:antitoxin FitA
MAELTIRKLKKKTLWNLKARAEVHGCSAEEETRRIIEAAVKEPLNLAEAIRRRFLPLGGVELEIPPREPMRDPEFLHDWVKPPKKKSEDAENTGIRLP